MRILDRLSVLWSSALLACGISTAEPPRHSGDAAHGTENVAADTVTASSLPADTHAAIEAVATEPIPIGLGGNIGEKNPDYAFIRGNGEGAFHMDDPRAIISGGPVLKKGELYVFDKKTGVFSQRQAAEHRGFVGTDAAIVSGTELKNLANGEAINGELIEAASLKSLSGVIERAKENKAGQLQEVHEKDLRRGRSRESTPEEWSR